MQKESTSGGGSRDGDVKVHGEVGAPRGTVTNREAREK